MICMFCGENKKLGNSHIIPRGFFPKSTVDLKPTTLLTNSPGEYPKRAPVGIYDKTILCLSCERVFDRLDSYAQQLLCKQSEKHFDINFEGERIGYEIQSYDYKILKKFFVSLLWRSSVSKHSFYSRINIGKFESIALEVLKSDREIPLHEFSVVLAKFDHELGMSVLDPHPTRFDGIKHNVFYLGGYIAYIKTDSRRTPVPLSEFTMELGRPLRIISRSLMGSKELEVFRSILGSMPMDESPG